MSVSEMFITIQSSLTADQDIRDEIRKVVQVLEQTAREILTVLQSVHQTSGFKDIPVKCQKAREYFSTVRSHLATLKTKFPGDHYYRFETFYRSYASAPANFVGLFFILFNSPVTVYKEVAPQSQRLGKKLNLKKTMHFIERSCVTKLFCLLQSRLAVNSVTAGDYSRPLRISSFINELDSGFRLLNLKNDSLRKRYDGLKYDVKKIEEVVYDLSIRGLAKEQEAGDKK
uniref:Translin n=1 Tax=Latimeria chalumnae TaxID=7897 RepID=H3A8E0_LATCH